MEKKEFKKALTNTLKSYGFEYIKKCYYYDNDELIIVIATQKSNYDNSYYLNYGFLIKQINPGLEYPKDYVCDVKGRFLFENDTKFTDCINLDNCDIDVLKKGIDETFQSYIVPIIEKGLLEYYRICPKNILTATLKTKKHLNMK